MFRELSRLSMSPSAGKLPAHVLEALKKYWLALSEPHIKQPPSLP